MLIKQFEINIPQKLLSEYVRPIIQINKKNPLFQMFYFTMQQLQHSKLKPCQFKPYSKGLFIPKNDKQ